MLNGCNIESIHFKNNGEEFFNKDDISQEFLNSIYFTNIEELKNFIKTLNKFYKNIKKDVKKEKVNN